MEPVRIKVYGLLPMTRRRYLSQILVAGLLALTILVLWWSLWPRLREMLQLAEGPGVTRIIAFWDAAPWFLLGLGVLQGIEAYFVLKRFARREAQAHAQPLDKEIRSDEQRRLPEPG